MKHILVIICATLLVTAGGCDYWSLPDKNDISADGDSDVDADESTDTDGDMDIDADLSDVDDEELADADDVTEELAEETPEEETADSDDEEPADTDDATQELEEENPEEEAVDGDDEVTEAEEDPEPEDDGEEAPCTCTGVSDCCPDGCYPAGAGTNCGNGPETCSAQDTCDGNGVCQPNHEALDGTSCDDGDKCNGLHTCTGGACLETGTAVICTALDECHDVGVCEPSTGVCSNPNKADGTACGTEDQCVNGICVDCYDALGCDDLELGGRDDECVEVVCKPNHLCQFNFVAQGSVCDLVGRTSGDDQCDDQGFCRDCIDQSGCSDLADDGLECSEGACGDDKTCFNNPAARADEPCTSDGLFCTDDLCGLDGHCHHTLQDNACYINGGCYGSGSSMGYCRYCNPGADPYQWSDRDNGSSCYDGHACTTESCQDGVCAVQSIEYGCFIDNTCYGENAKKGSTGNDSCQACVAATDWSDWSVLESGSCDDGDLCTINDSCTPGGICTGEDPCNGHGTCDPVDGSCHCVAPYAGLFCALCMIGRYPYPDCQGWCGDGIVQEGYEICDSQTGVSCTTINPSIYTGGTAYCSGECLYWDDSTCEKPWHGAQRFPVPPTNQSKCYDNSTEIACPTGVPASCDQSTPEDFCGQDGQYPDNGRTYACYDASGVETPCASLPTALENEVVTDSLTGLMWQRMWTYGGQWWSDESRYCQNLNYGGHSDWRLPTIHELRSIIDYDKGSTTIDIVAFPSNPNGPLWSSSERGGFFAWYVDLSDSEVYYDQQIEPLIAPDTRCVRGRLSNADIWSFDPFTVSGPAGAETVRDKVTGLLWQKDYATNKTWMDALSYCEGLDYAGHQDWRLPNAQSLASLANYMHSGPASSFPDMPSNYFWSSTSITGNPSRAWLVSFNYGSLLPNSASTKTNAYHARCVRGGPVTAWEFNHDGDTEGWELAEISPATTPSVGTWTFNVSLQDPKMQTEGPYIFGEQYRYVAYRMKNCTGYTQGQVFWANMREPFFTEQRSFMSTVHTDCLWHIYVVDTSQVQGWTGPIKAMRLDPVHWGSGEISIDWIRLLNSLEGLDSDDDGIPDDGDGSLVSGDNPCIGGEITSCDDNCPFVANFDQADADNDGIGDVCDN